MEKNTYGKVYFHTSEKMRELKDGSVDFVIAHPPYLRPKDKKFEMFENWHLYHKVFEECYRVLKENKVMVVVNTDVKRNDFFAKHSFIAKIMGNVGFKLRDVKVWVRTKNNRFDRLGYSYVQVFSKGDYKRLKVNKNFEAGVWELPFSMNVGKFRDAFCGEIPQWCIDVFTKPNDLVVDPFLGAGTTYWAALLAGRNFVGYEIDKGLKKLIYKKNVNN